MSVSGATSSRFEISVLLRYATWGLFPLGHVTFFLSLLALRYRVWLWSVTEAETKNGRVKRAPPVAPKFQTRRKSRRGSLKTTAILLYDSRPIPWEFKHFKKSLWNDFVDFNSLKIIYFKTVWWIFWFLWKRMPPMGSCLSVQTPRQTPSRHRDRPRTVDKKVSITLI